MLANLAKDMFAQDIITRGTANYRAKYDQTTKIPPDHLPQTNGGDESLHMQLSYKQAIEIAEEEAITQTLAKNKWRFTKAKIKLRLSSSVVLQLLKQVLIKQTV